jgi:hypothetical protein
MINFGTAVTCRLLAGTVWLTAKHLKIFLISDKYHSTKTNKLTYIIRGTENATPVHVHFLYCLNRLELT